MGLPLAEEPRQKLDAVAGAQVANRGGEDHHADRAHGAHPAQNRPFAATALGVAVWLDAVPEVQHLAIGREVVVALDLFRPVRAEQQARPEHEREQEGGHHLDALHPQISTCATAQIAAATVHAARAIIAAPSLLMMTTSLSMVSFMVSTSPLMRESTDAPKISESRSGLWTSG